MNVAVRYLPLVFQFGAFQGPLNLNNAYFECDILLNTRTVASFDGLVIQAIYHLVQSLKRWLFYIRIDDCEKIQYPGYCILCEIEFDQLPKMGILMGQILRLESGFEACKSLASLASLLMLFQFNNVSLVNSFIDVIKINLIYHKSNYE